PRDRWNEHRVALRQEPRLRLAAHVAVHRDASIGGRRGLTRPEELAGAGDVEPRILAPHARERVEHDAHALVRAQKSEVQEPHRWRRGRPGPARWKLRETPRRDAERRRVRKESELAMAVQDERR